MGSDPSTTLKAAIDLAQTGALDQAERLLRALIAKEPALARAHNALGVVLLQKGDLAEAESSLLRAAQADPQDARAHVNLGNLYAMQRRIDLAEKHQRRAIVLEPANAGAHFNLAIVLRQAGKAGEAEQELRRAVELDPSDSHAWVALGLALADADKLDEAEASFRTAIRKQPANAEAHYRLASVLVQTLRYAEAEASIGEALRLRPDFGPARSDLANLLLESARLREAQEACVQAMRASPGYLTGWSNYVMCSQYDPDLTDAELLARARQAGSAIRAAAERVAPMPAPAPRAQGLRIGFVSADLRSHPVGFLLLPLLRAVAGGDAQIHLYSNGVADDELSAEFRRLGKWTRIAELADQEACRRIREDRPDILIDLAGHTGYNRLSIFAARSAPVQISWLGYFGTTGTANMDFILMDPWHAPQGSEGQFTERVIRMPHSRFCFQPIASAPPVQPLAPVESRGHITFGCFNNIAKINERVLAAWSRIVRSVPQSRLVLKWRVLGDAAIRADFTARLRRAGFAPDSFELRPASAHAAMLAEYGGIDIALDTFPFTGGQTSFDATWMGVPVVSLAGNRPVSRQTLCIHGNLEQQELVAWSVDDYVERAVALAQDAQRLRAYRAGIRQRMQVSPLMQVSSFAQSFMDVLRTAAGAG